MRGYLAIVPVAARGSTGLYVRRGSGDPVGSLLSGSRVQGTGCGTDFANVTHAIMWQGVAAVMAARISIAESRRLCEQTRELLAGLRKRGYRQMRARA